jgi:hypothetical protein
MQSVHVYACFRKVASISDGCQNNRFESPFDTKLAALRSPKSLKWNLGCSQGKTKKHTQEVSGKRLLKWAENGGGTGMGESRCHAPGSMNIYVYIYMSVSD